VEKKKGRKGRKDVLSMSAPAPTRLDESVDWWMWM
jgi:hypothetical protein